jgi:hypothetical protein
MSITFFVDTEACEPETELNVANGNVQTILTLMGFDNANPEYGRVQPTDSPAVIRRLIKRQNDENKIAVLTKPTTQDGNVIECGRTNEQIKRYIKCLLTICSISVKKNLPIIWG